MDSEDKSLADVREGNPTAPKKTEEPKAPAESGAKLPEGETTVNDKAETKKKSTKEKRSKKYSKRKSKKAKKASSPAESSSSSDSDDDDGDGDGGTSSSSSSDDDQSETEAPKKNRVTKKRLEPQKAKKKARAKKHSKASSKAADPSASGSDSDSLDSDGSSSSDEDKDEVTNASLAQQLQQLILLQQQQQGGGSYGYPSGHNNSIPPSVYDTGLRRSAPRPRRGGVRSSGRAALNLGGVDPNVLLDANQLKDNKRQKATKLDYKRVDQVWDDTIHNYKLQDTAEGTVDAQYEEFIFHVRRTFDWEGKYKATVVDIKSKLLRECLQNVIGDIKGVSLVDDTPKLDPNMLFLYLEDLRTHLKELKKTKATKGDKRERKKEQKRIDQKRQHLRVLVKYINKDYADIKNSLYPMLENGLITFDLLWALWKPNTLAYTTTYGSHDEPRVFKVEMAEKHHNLMKGDYYYLEGKSPASDATPLKYHKNEEQLRKDLIERGKKFVSLGGVHYKSHQGMAYYKKKKSIIKVNINGRIMVDPSIHRRINPNYPISLVRPKDHDLFSDDDDSDESGCCGCDSDEEGEGGSDSEKPKFITKVYQDGKGKVQFIRVPKSDDDEATGGEKLDKSTKAKVVPEFSDEEYLIASPVVLGFAFAEKLWLEFTVSGVKEIQWNETAYESLVLEPKTKDIVKALVESHKYHAAESIDDVIQGKGKGLVAVLHGPPGTGKTLTAEGISELLKCPLYMASAGELGTDSRYLESELQKILDICHAWGAILLLDEADVFLEKRNMHDIHRNALVSIFLRQLEYFQGILFLTTNRVETFDDAFQSRIHIALRYDSLDHRAKKAIFKIFIERVRVLEKINLMPFSEEDYTALARHELNGRQIKNTHGAAFSAGIGTRARDIMIATAGGTSRDNDVLLPSYRDESIQSAIPAQNVTEVALRIRHLIEECIPCELKENHVTSPHSKVITSKVVQAAKEAGGREHGACVVYCLLVNKRWWRHQALVELWDADLHYLRAIACEVIAKKIIESEEDSDYLLHSVLLKRYSILVDGHATHPVNVIEKAVDLHALRVIGSSGYQKCINHLWRGWLVQDENDPATFVDYKDRDNTSYVAHLDPDRMRAPMYQNAVQMLMSFAYLGLYTVAMNTVNEDGGIDVVEVILYLFTLGFVCNELAKLWKAGYRILNFWNAFNSILYGLLITSFVFRCMALSHGQGDPDGLRHKYSTLSYSFLAVSAPMFWGRLLLYLDSYRFFGAMLVVLKVMMKESIIFFALLAFIIVGFLQAFIGLDYADDRTVEDILFIIQSMANAVMQSPDFSGFERFQPPFGLILYYCFTFVVMVVLLNILIALYNSAYEDIYDNANDEYLAIFAQKTMTFVRAPDENVFIAPFNLIEIFGLVLFFEWWMDKKTYEHVNDIVMGIIYSPLLLISAYFEVRWAQDIRTNRARGDADDDTVEEWEQMIGQFDFESDGWKKQVDSAKSNLEEDPAVSEVRILREEVDKLKEMIVALHKVVAEGNTKTESSES
ncbi:cation channel-like protein [Chaetomium fimeti]|uniref:Cation channel-like protein n=1 Tax=Chaetomium fimeti TaxID=1854472 RepID=A0AAE0LM72_9PEZI|nr:cation channel-like protein [Chaetomium fimeti]